MSIEEQLRELIYGSAKRDETPQVGGDLINQYGILGVRKALGLYTAALRHTTAGGEVIFRSADGKEKKWVPRP